VANRAGGDGGSARLGRIHGFEKKRRAAERPWTSSLRKNISMRMRRTHHQLVFKRALADDRMQAWFDVRRCCTTSLVAW
jgi:hypothetical protein